MSIKVLVNYCTKHKRKGPKLQKILRICLRSFVNFDSDTLEHALNLILSYISALAQLMKLKRLKV